MPFELKMSQEVFQTKIDETFEGCEGVVGIADDTVVFGKTTEEHDRNMKAMLNRCIDTGLKLNPDKCFVKQETIKFYGVICGQDGVKPDPGKVSALKRCLPYKLPGTANLPRASKLHGPIYPKPEYTDGPTPWASERGQPL